MGLTNFPNGILATPNLGGSNGGYAGWWGHDIFYVDDTDGNDAQLGKDPNHAKKTIQSAVDNAGPNDTIFLRPRDMGGDIVYPGYSAHGYYTGNVTTKTSQQGLSIIGTGSGGSGIGANIQCAIEPTSGSTAATILVQAPATSIENVMVKAITGNVAGGIGATSAYNTVQAWGLTISNCMFKDFKAAGAIGSVNLHTVHWATIQHCIFREAIQGICFHSTEALVKAPTVKDCTFMGVAADIDCNIRVGDVKSLLIDNCRFLHAKPTGGNQNIFINMVGAAGSGLISNCNFSHTSVTVAHFMTLVGTTLNAHCFGADAVIAT